MNRGTAATATAAASGNKTADTGAPAAAGGPPAGATTGKFEGAVAATCMPAAVAQNVACRAVAAPTQKAAAAVWAMPGETETATN